MSNKKRFIPLAVIGAVLMSLLVIAPVFSDDGELEFRVVDDKGEITSKTQQWVKQEGGKVGIRLTDADLNEVIKNVLLPSDMEEVTVKDKSSLTVTVERGERVIKVAVSGETELSALDLSKDKHVLFERTDVQSDTEQTVREVEGVKLDDDKTTFEITVDKAFDFKGEGKLHKIKPSTVTEWKDVGVDCSGICAMAEDISTEDTRRLSLQNYPVKASGVYNSDLDLKNRFQGGSPSSQITEKDVLIVALPTTTTAAANATSTPTSKYSLDAKDRISLEKSGKFDDNTYALYWGNINNTTRHYVTAISEQNNKSVTVVLTETGRTSGIFVGSLETSINGAGGTLEVDPDDEITVKYDDPEPGDDKPTETITVESTPPTFANFTPENGYADRAQRQEIEVDVTDAESGIASAKKIWVVFAHDTNDDKKLDEDKEDKIKVQEVGGGGGTSTSIDDGFSISITNEHTEDDTTLFWWVVAEDVAGNIGVSDRVTQYEGANSECDADIFWNKGKPDLANKSVKITHDEDAEKNSDGVEGCQPYSIRIDTKSPKMSDVYTGQFWDTSKELDERKKFEASKPESIRVVFDAELDGSTVSADDFEVDGTVPSAADFYTEMAGSVFLTVPTLGANDKPSVEMVGEVADKAGNKLKKGAKDAEIAKAMDRIKPTLTVSLEGSYSGGSRVLTDKDITVTIESDEPISQPTVIIHKIEANEKYQAKVDEVEEDKDNNVKAVKPVEAKGKILDENGDEQRATQVRGAKNTYSAKFSVSPSEPGLYSVYVEANDTASGNGKNKGTKGATKTPVDISKATKHLLFEVDTGIASFKVNPESTDDPKAFITLDYSDEANEYYKDDDDSEKSQDYDSFSKLTIVEATLIDPDGEKTDITDALNASANSAGTKFRYNDPDGLALGEYKLEVKAKDEAGNEETHDDEFKIEERAPFKVELAPGSNFISFPSNPHDTDINKVIPADHPVTRVLTYDPKVPGGWLTAVRGEDGMFEGTLKELTARRAYIITTDSFDALEVSIPKPSASATAFLPTIQLSKGWNLVPIVDIDGDFRLSNQKYDGVEEDEKGNVPAKDTPKPGYSYYGKADGDISITYTFDTSLNAWLSKDGKDVEIGKGYWVYAAKSVILIPN